MSKITVVPDDQGALWVLIRDAPFTDQIYLPDYLALLSDEQKRAFLETHSIIEDSGAS